MASYDKFQNLQMLKGYFVIFIKSVNTILLTSNIEFSFISNSKLLVAGRSNMIICDDGSDCG